jgi:hypothetical protein
MRNIVVLVKDINLLVAYLFLCFTSTHTHTQPTFTTTPQNMGFSCCLCIYLFGADSPKFPHIYLLVILLCVHTITLARLFLQSTSSYSLPFCQQVTFFCYVHPQKSGGCNKMVCCKCNTFFCWLCMECLNPKDPYPHFSNPASECNNRLFYGVSNLDDDDDFWVPPGAFLENDE